MQLRHPVCSQGSPWHHVILDIRSLLLSVSCSVFDSITRVLQATSVQLTLVTVSSVLFAALVADASPYQPASNHRRVTAVVPGYEYTGCYTEATNMRALSGSAFFDDFMTVEKCVVACEGYKYFGVEYGREVRLRLAARIFPPLTKLVLLWQHHQSWQRGNSSWRMLLRLPRGCYRDLWCRKPTEPVHKLDRCCSCTSANNILLSWLLHRGHQRSCSDRHGFKGRRHVCRELRRDLFRCRLLPVWG